MISLIVGIKDRTDHFLQTFPFMISQRGIDYELIIVDWNVDTSFIKTLFTEYERTHESRSENLKHIKCIYDGVGDKYNPRKVKNLGTAVSTGDILAYTDIDVMLSMDYLSYWSNQVVESKSFLCTRHQETLVSESKRISPEVNYGNIMVAKSDVITIGGWDESVSTYGGDDDDLCHRLKLLGLREINPYNKYDARQYSILHKDDLRLDNMEEPKRDPDAFKKIRSKTNYLNVNNHYLNCYDKYATITLNY